MPPDMIMQVLKITAQQKTTAQEQVQQACCWRCCSCAASLAPSRAAGRLTCATVVCRSGCCSSARWINF